MKKCMIIFDRLVDLAAVAGGAVLLFIIASVSLSVVLRYAFDYTLLWLFDTTEVLLVLLCFLLVTWVLKRERHVRMDLVINKLSTRTRHMIDFITSIIAAGMCLTVAWYSASTSFTHFRMGMYTEEYFAVPTGALHAIFVVGSIPLFIQFIRRAGQFLRQWKGALGDEQEP